MMVVCKDQLDQLQASERMGAAAAAAVETDVTALLATKSYDDLVVLQKQIQAKLSSGEPVDIDYWESLLKKLLVWKAKVSYRYISKLYNELTGSKAKLKALHEVVVRNRLEQLRKRQRDEAIQAQEELLAGVAKSASRNWGGNGRAEIVQTDAVEQEVVPAEEVEAYDRSMSPPLLDISSLPSEERQINALTEEEDRRALVSDGGSSVLKSQ